MTTQEADSTTRTKLLDAAEELMISRGYVATSVDAICSAAGVTKGSFFHYFNKKEDLGKHLLVRFAGRQQDRMLAGCSQIEDPLARVYAIVESAIQAARNPESKGCLVGTFAQEISETHPELRDVCRICFENFATHLGSELIEAKKRHCPGADFDASGLGEYFLSLAQGSMLLARTSSDRHLMERNLVFFRDYLKNLYGK